MIPVYQGMTTYSQLIIKKRKPEAIYLNGQWKDEDEYEDEVEIAKLRQVIHNHTFKHLKFVKGEGTKSCCLAPVKICC